MNSTTPIRVIVADDHHFFLDGLKMVIARHQEYAVVATCKNGQELITAVQEKNPDLVITDISMPLLSGVQAIKAIREFNKQLPFLILSGLENEFLIVESLEAGALGYINKMIAYEELYEAMNTVRQQVPYYCSTTSNKLAKMIANSYFNPYAPVRSNLFNDLEKQIIRLICEDKKTTEIADILSLGERTIENYRSKIARKMNVRTTAGVAIYALKHEMFFLKD